MTGPSAITDLLENLRASLEDKGVKPVLTDTLRPGQDQQLTLVRHLSSAGVLRAFIAADRDDVAVLARDITESGLPITLLAGASLDTTPGTVQLAAGVQALVLSDAAAAGSNAELVKALRAANIEPEGYVMRQFRRWRPRNWRSTRRRRRKSLLQKPCSAGPSILLPDPSASPKGTN